MASKIKYYHYLPSLAAACLFAILFGVATVWHVFLIAKHRTWYFVPVVVGGICTYQSTFFWLTVSWLIFTVVEIAGYTARAVSHSQAPNLTLGPYVITTLLLLVAPPLFAASLYMTLGRIIVGVEAESKSLIKRRWLTKVFVTSDVVCFIVQLGGTHGFSARAIDSDPC